jgi:hypothetical protein
MRKSFLLSVCLSFVLGQSAFSTTITDGFEGPYDFPPATFDFDTDGAGLDADWFADQVEWVGNNQFLMDVTSVIHTEGDVSQMLNSADNDGNIRDLYLARYVDGLEAGVEYTVSLDYRYDQYEDTNGLSNHIQVDIRDGDHRDRFKVADIENYGGHERPNTVIVDDTTFGTGTFHTLKLTHTPAEGETAFTFLAIIRFHSPELEDNWVYLDNFTVTDEVETNIIRWELY